MKRLKPTLTQVISLPLDTVHVHRDASTGTLYEKLKIGITRLLTAEQMSKLKKTLGKTIVAGLCAVGLCALSRKLDLPTRVAAFAHNVEGVPFPGTKMYAFLAARQLRPMYAAIAKMIAAADGFERILDIGTGPGYLPIEIAQLEPETCVTGVDQSSEMIQIADTNAHASRVSDSVDFATGDPTNLPFPGRHFEFVVSVNVLHHWPEPCDVFDEVFHVLRPGGQFWIFDYRKDVPKEQWESLRKKLPVSLRLALLFGPVASSNAAYTDDQLLAMAAETHFECFGLEQITLPLFGHTMPVFNVLKLRKPDLDQD